MTVKKTSKVRCLYVELNKADLFIMIKPQGNYK
jgi:hypothetical protein